MTNNTSRIAAVLLASAAVIAPTAQPFGGWHTPSVSGMVATAGAQAGAESDPALKQTVSDEEKFIPSGTAHAFTRGHADLGVRMDDGKLTIVLRDDAQEQPVWRDLDDVVFVAPDAAKQTLPTDGKYDFTGATGGQDVWVLPQTEVQGVPWLGWNTQSPALIDNVNQGVSMEFMGHQGPGQLTMFLQAGGFAEPDQLWDSSKPTPQGIWVDSNTHTHANWVFTEPGVHLIKLRIKATGKDGQEHSVDQLVRFAVGGAGGESTTDGLNAQALAAKWTKAESDDNQDGGASSGSGSSDSSGNGGTGGTADNGDSAGDSAQKQDNQESNSAFMWMLGGLGALVLIVLVAGLVLKRKTDSLRREVDDQIGSGEAPNER